jgi:hypothetical protein
LSRAFAVRLAMVVDCQRDLSCLKKNPGRAENAVDWQAAALALGILRPAAFLPHRKPILPLPLWLARSFMCDRGLRSTLEGELHLDVFGLAQKLDALSEASALRAPNL